jgi:hypothetical protein
MMARRRSSCTQHLNSGPHRTTLAAERSGKSNPAVQAARDGVYKNASAAKTQAPNCRQYTPPISWLVANRKTCSNSRLRHFE